MQDDSEAKAVLKVWSIIFVSLSYCYFIVSKIPNGKFRLLFLLPLFVLYTILPLSLSCVFTTGITSSFITWLTISKLLLYSFDLGPLAEQKSDVRSLTNIRSFFKFVFIAAFPTKIKDTTSYSTNSSKVLPLNFWSKVLVSSILIAIFNQYREKLQVGIVLVTYSCLLCCLVDIAMGLSNMLVGSMMGLEVIEPSNEPYLATSLQDFWGRWNLMVTHTLRHTVYNPTRLFSSKYLGRELSLAVGTLAAFSVSGLMHELIFYYVTRVSPSWEVTWFFVLQGICVTIEVALKRTELGKRLRLHRAVTNPLTVGFVMGTGYLWFFRPLVRNKVDLRAIQELKSLYESFISLFKWGL